MKVFNTLSKTEQDLLVKLENRDTKEREDNVETKLRLRQIPRVTGEFLYGLVAASVVQKENWTGLEIGSSGGYSTIWQSLALKNHKKGKLITLDIDPAKIIQAKSNLEQMKLLNYVTVQETDAFKYINASNTKFDYIFLDAEKSDYLAYVKLLKEKSVRPGSICVADNVISHADDLKDLVDFLESDKDIHYTLLTIGKGLAFIEFLI